MSGSSGKIAKLSTIDFTPDNVATIKLGHFKVGFYSIQSEDLMAELVTKIDSKNTQNKSRGRCHQPLEECLQTNEQNKTKKSGPFIFFTVEEQANVLKKSYTLLDLQ